MPRARATQEAQQRLRAEVLALVGVDPAAGASAIARRAAATLKRDVSESTVRGIIARFGASADALLADAKRSGRKPKFPKRIRRCDLCNLKIVSFFICHRAIVALARKHPKWGARQLANEVHEKTVAALLARPAGAVVRMPPKPSPKQVCRYWPCFRERMPISILGLRFLKAAGLTCHRAPRVPLLSKKHMAARLTFAKKMMRFDWSKACLHFVRGLGNA